ncbi:MAG TPA: ABC transporter permease [Firmicutes bacterium]|jgi:peptide/nickel transport system permease protein|nr:ABC transporter permease [Candidatus Fermentithermobacillaceae bacterium]
MVLRWLQRIGVYFLVLLGLSILVFVIARVIPGDPARQALGPRVSEETVQALREKLNLDKPLFTQYVLWFKGAIRLDLGDSLLTRRPVIEDVRRYLPATLEIVLLSAVFMAAGGILFGIVATKYTGKWQDALIRVLSYLGIVSPPFVWAVLFMLLFGYIIPVLPTTGRIAQSVAAPTRMITGMYTVDYLLTGNLAGWWDAFKHLLLPSIALMLGGMAQAARLTRSNMVENSMKDYIQAQQAYGVPEKKLLYKYLLKPSLIPTISILALDIAAVFGNAFLVENLFNYPGLSRYGLSAMLNKDINAISGVVMVFGLIFILVNILSDMVVAWLDPRVRLMGGADV